MPAFVRLLRIIGRALRRCIFAVGRSFKFLGKRITRNSKTAKLNKRIAKKEKALEELYSEIGRNYYEAHSDAPEELLSALCGEVGGNLSAIGESQEKIAALKAAYDEEKAEAREKAKARRASDKEAARAEKEAYKAKKAEAEAGEAVAEESAPAVFQQPASMPAIEIPAEPDAPAEPDISAADTAEEPISTE